MLRPFGRPEEPYRDQMGEHRGASDHRKGTRNPLPLEDGIGLMQEMPSTITRTMLLGKEAP